MPRSDSDLALNFAQQLFAYGPSKVFKTGCFFNERTGPDVIAAWIAGS
jgi:hypothetical protein